MTFKLSPEWGLLFSGVVVGVASIIVACLVFRIYRIEKKNPAGPSGIVPHHARISREKAEIGLLASWVLIAIGGVAAALFTFKIADNADEAEVGRFNKVIGRFDDIAKKMENQEEADSTRFANSINRLDAINKAEQAALGNTERELKRRLVLSLQTMHSLKGAFRGNEFPVVETPEAKRRLQEVGRELLDLTWREAFNPFLKQLPTIESAWQNLHRKVTGLTFAIAGGYSYKYDELRDALDKALVGFQNEIGVYHIDKNGTLQYDDYKVRRTITFP